MLWGRPRYGKICNFKGYILPSSEDVPQGRPVDLLKIPLYGFINKAKKRPGDKDFLIWFYHKWMWYYKNGLQAQQVDDTEFVIIIIISLFKIGCTITLRKKNQSN